MEGTITFRTTISTQPWLCRHDPLKTYPTYKVYRGRKEKCITPRWADGLDCVPMSLITPGIPELVPVWVSRVRRGAFSEGPPPDCGRAQGFAINAFNADIEKACGSAPGSVRQDARCDWDNFYSAAAVRSFWSYVFPSSYEGIPAEDFSGFAFSSTCTATPLWPVSPWNVKVLGSDFSFVPSFGEEAQTVVCKTRFVSGGRYDFSIRHTDYDNMRPYPLCGSGINIISSLCGVSNIFFLLHDYYEWTYTFTPPYYDNWWICYPDLQGGLLPIYPVGDKTVIGP